METKKDKSQLTYENLIDYRVCELLYFRFKKTKYSTFKNMCENLRGMTTNQVSISSLEQILVLVMLDISTLYGLEDKETLKILINFLRDKKWEKYHDLMLTFLKTTPNSFQ